MPAHRTQIVKRHACDFGDCDKSFASPFDLRRHKVLHEGGERQFKCPEEMCTFSAHQKGNLNVHIKSQHKKIRYPCGVAHCDKTFADASSRIKHRRIIHFIVKLPRMEFTTVPVSIPVHRSVIRHVEENSPEKVEEILKQFATFTVESLGMPTPSDPSAPSSSSSNIAVPDKPSAPLPLPSTSAHDPDPKPPWSIPPATSQSITNRNISEGIQDVAYHNRQTTLPGPAKLLNEWRRHRENEDGLYRSRSRHYSPMDYKRRPYLPNLF